MSAGNKGVLMTGLKDDCWVQCIQRKISWLFLTSPFPWQFLQLCKQQLNSSSACKNWGWIFIPFSSQIINKSINQFINTSCSLSFKSYPEPPKFLRLWQQSSHSSLQRAPNRSPCGIFAPSHSLFILSGHLKNLIMFPPFQKPSAISPLSSVKSKNALKLH